MKPDFVTDVPLTNRGNDSILTLVNSLSKMAHFVPVKRSYTATDMVEPVAGGLIRNHRFPDMLISDPDSHFQWDL